MKANQVTEAIEVERAQIAAEVHDALLPLIFAASAALQQHLSVGERSKLTETESQRLDQAAGWLQEALQTGRRIINQSCPPDAIGRDWMSAAQESLTNLYGDAARSIQWDVQAAPETFAEEEGFACFRIVVEAVRNAIRHAKAKTISVSSSEVGGQTVITIADDGQGFDVDNVQKESFGLRAMRIRAELVGGQLDVESGEGIGTKVRFSLPRAN